MGFSRLFLIFLRRSSPFSSQASWSYGRKNILLNPFLSERTPKLQPYTGMNHRALLSTSADAHNEETIDPRLAFVAEQIEELETQSGKQQNLESHNKEVQQTTLQVDMQTSKVGIQHPWPEWTALIECLVKNGYFKIFADDEDNDDEEEGFGNTFDMSNDYNHVRNACLNFGRDRFDILRSLSKEDIRAIMEYGCPSLDRKVVNSGKRLRSYVNIEEGEVCSRCNSRGNCDRAYINAPKEECARTVDVMRVLLTYGLDPMTGSSENKLHMKKTVKASIRKLLKEVVELSAIPLDRNVPWLIPKLPQPTSKQSRPSTRKWIGYTNVEMKKGDWLCPRCNLINFARNMICIQCNEKRPKNQLNSGEWKCPDCNFINFSRNMKCLKCDCKRPKDDNAELLKQLNPEDWVCPTCNFLNFRRNTQCLECDGKHPNNYLEMTNQLNTGDWKCQQCHFMNFGRNMTCLKCECKRPNDTIARQLNPTGDWKCPKCNFLNFRRNTQCLECDGKHPNNNLEMTNQLNTGDWKCQQCGFLNFRRNMTCLKCDFKRPKHDCLEMARQHGNDCWVDDTSGLQQSKHTEQKSVGMTNSSKAWNDDLGDDDECDCHSKYDDDMPNDPRGRMGGSTVNNVFNFDDFPVHRGKSGITGGRKSEQNGNKTFSRFSMGGDRSSSSGLNANDFSDLDLDLDDNDDDSNDDDVHNNWKRADGGRSAGKPSDRYGRLSTSVRNGVSIDNNDLNFDDFLVRGGKSGTAGRRKSEKNGNKTFSQRSSGVDISLSSRVNANEFSDLDDNDIDYNLKSADGGRSPGRASDRYGSSSTSARGKRKAYNFGNTDDEDGWFGCRQVKGLGTSERPLSSKPKPELKSYEKFLNLVDNDADDLVESEDEQPLVSRTKKREKARSFGMGKDKIGRQTSSTSQATQRVESDDGLDELDDLEDNEDYEDPVILYDKISKEKNGSQK